MASFVTVTTHCCQLIRLVTSQRNTTNRVRKIKICVTPKMNDPKGLIKITLMKTLTDATEFERTCFKCEVRWSQQNHLLASLSDKILVVEVVDFKENSFSAVQSELDEVTLRIQLKVNIGKSTADFSGSVRHENTVRCL